MNRIPRIVWLHGLVALVMLAGDRLGTAEDSLVREFKADEPVQSLTVKMDVGAAGEDLSEPIALDLGLGFPCWLQPVGRKPDEMPPFGAVPQQTTASTRLAAGSSASFTFSLTGEAGQDVLQTTPQLLAGVRVSDVARIGFASQPASNWILAGYEIQINGRPFVRRANLNASAQKARQAAAAKSAQVDAQLKKLLWQEQVATSSRKQPKPDDATVLAALVRFSFSTPPLAEDPTAAPLSPEARALQAQQKRVRALLAGKYPWMEDPEFRSPWRAEAAGQSNTIQTARVFLETSAHNGADTRNYVYVQTGGHKYLVASAENPLTARGGAQEFPLDLLAGPLTAADIRGWAVGMLAAPAPGGKAPDRWHPQRLLVEFDGRAIYDSEESPLDRRSLEAIRLIPPANFDSEGKLLLSTPNARETSVWQSGSGAGLDLARGGALPLPVPGDPQYPLPEPGPAPGSENLPPSNLPSPPPAEGPTAPAPFPEENAPSGDWADGGPGQPGQPMPSPSDPGGSHPGGQPQNPWLPPTVDPPSAGTPFQIESVKLASGWKKDDVFTIQWKVSGDESQIDRYDVSLRVVRPDRPEVYFEQVLRAASVPKDQRQYTGTVDATIVVNQPYYFLAPMVVAVPTDASKNTPLHQRIGAARAVFPVGTQAGLQPALDGEFSYTRPPSLMLGKGTVAFGGQPPGTARAVWPLGQLDSHNAIAFDAATPGLSVGVRPETGDAIQLACTVSSFTGRHRLVAHLGFLGGTTAANPMDVELSCRLTDAAGTNTLKAYPVVSQQKLGPSGLMGQIEQVIDAADAGAAGPHRLSMTFSIRGGDADPAHPPTLVGVRLVPEMPGNAVPLAEDTKKINADLAIIVPKRLEPEKTRRPGQISLVPDNLLIVKNLGPDKVPYSFFDKLELPITWRTAPWGDDLGQVKDTRYYAPLSTTGKVRGYLDSNELGVGQQREFRIDIHEALLPLREAVKCFGVEIKLVYPKIVDGQELVDPHPENNTYVQMEDKPLIVGKDPLPWELAVYEDTDFKKPLAYWEAPPTLRQHLVPGMDKTLQSKIRAIRTGRKVAAFGFSRPDFEDSGPPWKSTVNTKTVLGDWSGKIASLIVVGDRDLDLDPKTTRSFGGVVLFAGGTVTGGIEGMPWTWPKIDFPFKFAKCFPAPERRGKKEITYHSLGDAEGHTEYAYLVPDLDPEIQYNAGYTLSAWLCDTPDAKTTGQMLGPGGYSLWKPPAYWVGHSRSLRLSISP